MNYALLNEVVALLAAFESDTREGTYPVDLNGFKQWIVDEHRLGMETSEPQWEGKDKGRSAESAISTLLVHLNRYAKSYSKSAIYGSGFSTQEEFIYLINLRAYGAMNKMQLIRKNVQDKPTGMQIINRLLQNGWVTQEYSPDDRRSKLLSLTDAGSLALDKQMEKIRQATRVVSGDLLHQEKMDLIRLLNKLDHFHKPIFEAGIDNAALLEQVMKDYMPSGN